MSGTSDFFDVLFLPVMIRYQDLNFVTVEPDNTEYDNDHTTGAQKGARFTVDRSQQPSVFVSDSSTD